MVLPQWELVILKITAPFLPLSAKRTFTTNTGF